MMRRRIFLQMLDKNLLADGGRAGREQGTKLPFFPMEEGPCLGLGYPCFRSMVFRVQEVSILSLLPYSDWSWVKGVPFADWTLASQGPLIRAPEVDTEDCLFRLSGLRVTSTP